MNVTMGRIALERALQNAHLRPDETICRGGTNTDPVGPPQQAIAQLLDPQEYTSSTCRQGAPVLIRPAVAEQFVSRQYRTVAVVGQTNFQLSPIKDRTPVSCSGTDRPSVAAQARRRIIRSYLGGDKHRDFYPSENGDNDNRFMDGWEEVYALPRSRGQLSARPCPPGRRGERTARYSIRWLGLFLIRRTQIIQGAAEHWKGVWIFLPVRLNKRS
jgi:hypothetical protein